MGLASYLSLLQHGAYASIIGVVRVAIALILLCVNLAFTAYIRREMINRAAPPVPRSEFQAGRPGQH